MALVRHSIPSGRDTTLSGHAPVAHCTGGPLRLDTPSATYMPGLAPAIMTMRRAMRLCRFHFSTAAATQMTPTSSSVVFLKYSAATCRGQHGHPPTPPHPGSPPPLPREHGTGQTKPILEQRLANKEQGVRVIKTANCYIH